MASRSSPEVSARLVILVADLTGYTRLFSSHSDLEMVAFLDRYYAITEDSVSTGGGQVIKFIGDAVLAVFPEEGSSRAVATAVDLMVKIELLAKERGLDMALGCNVHIGPAVLTELGHGASRRLDVIGRTVNQTFLLGRGSGIRISEPVYRQLPSGERSPWDKKKPPAVYVLGESGEPYAVRRKMAAENAMRW